MIEKLTAEQEALMPVYRDRYIEKGLCTNRASQEEAKEFADYYYEKILNKKKVPVILMDSPLSAWLAVCLLANDQVENQVRNQVRNQALDQIRDQVRNQVWDQVQDQVLDQANDQIRDQVENQVRNQALDQIRDQVWDQVWNQVRNQVRNQVENQVWDQVRNQALDQIRDQVRNQVWDQVLDQIQDQVLDQANDQIRDQVENQVWNQVLNQVRNQVENQVWNQVRDQVRNQVWNQVRNQVQDQVLDQVENQVQDQVRNQALDQIRDQVENQVWNQVLNQVQDQVRNQVLDYIHPYIDGHLMSHYFAYYSYMIEVLRIKLSSTLLEKYRWYELSLNFGNFYPLENICVISQKPIKINIVNERLHCDGGAAIEYADGFKVWSLNGIRVPQYLAETPSGALDIDFFLKEKNADVKAEFVKKYGIERLSSLGKVVDSYKNYDNLNQLWKDSEYELIDMASIHERLNKALYLKMKNLSVPGLYHMEGVSNSCKTIHDALSDRWERNSEEYETINIK